jgi:hypothetical protein
MAARVEARVREGLLGGLQEEELGGLSVQELRRVEETLAEQLTKVRQAREDAITKELQEARDQARREREQAQRQRERRRRLEEEQQRREKAARQRERDEKEEERAGASGSSRSRGEGAEASAEEAQRVARALEEQENSRCVICQDAAKTVLLLPCRHLCVCSGCSDDPHAQEVLRRCPMCRQPVDERIDVFS